MANDLPVVCLVIYNLRHAYVSSKLSHFSSLYQVNLTGSDVNMTKDLMLPVNPQLEIFYLSRLWS